MVHVQSCCFANQTYCFLTFSLRFASLDLKVPSHPLRRHWERYDPLLVLFEDHRHVSPLSIYSGSLLCVLRDLTIRQRRRPFRSRWKIPFSFYLKRVRSLIQTRRRHLGTTLRIFVPGNGATFSDDPLLPERKLKQPRRRGQQERQKCNRFGLTKQQLCTCSTFVCTFICRRCTTTTWKWLIWRFVEDANTRQQLSFSFPELLMQSIRIQLQKNLPTFDERNEIK